MAVAKWAWGRGAAGFTGRDGAGPCAVPTASPRTAGPHPAPSRPPSRRPAERSPPLSKEPREPRAVTTL